MRRQFTPGPVLHIFGNRSGISHLLHAPSANPSEITIRTVQIFRMRATPSRSAVWQIFSDTASQTAPRGISQSWPRPSRAFPRAVSTIRDDFMAPPFSMRTKPSHTAFSQIGMRGQVLRQASMVSP